MEEVEKRGEYRKVREKESKRSKKGGNEGVFIGKETILANKHTHH